MCFFLLSFSIEKETYSEIFGEDYERAKKYNEEHGTQFEMVANRFGTDQRFLKSIIFPELIRYSYFSDLFETGALEWLYIEGGSKSADFSVGRFQMKPSFVEAIEGYVSSEESLKEEYGFILLNGSGSPLRSLRLERLKQEHWQLIYLSCFVEITQHKFSSEVFSSVEDKLRFFCAAYNSGFMQSAAEIKSKINIKSFPYGARYSDDQFAYSDVALEYFLSIR